MEHMCVYRKIDFSRKLVPKVHSNKVVYYMVYVSTKAIISIL